MSLLDVHAKVQFQVLAPILGLAPIAKSTVNAKCPYCGANAWSIYQDNRNLEEWHYCSQCKVSGSILAMAAEHLGVPEAEVLDTLIDQLGLKISPEDRIEFQNSQDYRRRFQTAWSEARDNLKYLQRPQHQYLQGLGWQRPATMGLERFLAGPGQLYGMLSPEAANQHFRQIFPPTQPMLAVVPYFRTPTEIGGFACFPQHREVFITCPTTSPEASITGEIGFAGFQLLQKVQSRHLIVTSMLSPMVMMHMHNFNTSKIPLPLIASRYGYGPYRERQWSPLSGRNLILWERAPSAPMLHQAMLTNASIVFLGPVVEPDEELTGSRWWKWVHNEPARDMMSRLLRNADPYEKALAKWSRCATEDEKVKLLKEAEQYSTPVYDLVHRIVRPGVDSEFGRRITVPTRSQYPGGDHMVGYTVLIEQKKKWLSRSGHVRLAGILRVEHLVIRNQSREYIGYFENDDKRIDFRVPVTEASWSYLSNLVLENGVMLRSERANNLSNREENFCPFDAACRFEPPEIVRGLEQIGWDGAGFQFRRARLVQGVFHQIPDFMFATNVPGPQQSQCRLTEEVCISLARANPEMEATWALALALAAQVTAPCVGLPIYGVWVHRPEIDAGLSQLYNRLEVRRGDYKHWPHRWFRRLDESNNVQRYDSTGFFVLATPRPRASSIRDTITVDLQKLELQPRLFSHSADKILLNYLRHFTQLTLPKVTTWPQWLKFTSDQFRSVFTCADTKTLRAAIKRLDLR